MRFVRIRCSIRVYFQPPSPFTRQTQAATGAATATTTAAFAIATTATAELSSTTNPSLSLSNGQLRATIWERGYIETTYSNGSRCD